MLRRINSTGRVKIPKADMSLLFTDEKDGCRLNGSIRIDGFGQPSFPAEPFLELRVKVGSHYDEFRSLRCSETVKIDYFFEGISKDHAPEVEVRIYGGGDPLASISHKGDWKEGLGDLQGMINMKLGSFKYPLWKFDLTDFFNVGPILWVSEDVAERKPFVLADDFKALVFPEMIRQVLHHVLVEEMYQRDYYQFNEISDKWMRWAFTRKGSPQYETTGSETQRHEWVNKITEVFTRECLALQMSQYTQDEEED